MRLSMLLQSVKAADPGAGIRHSLTHVGRHYQPLSCIPRPIRPSLGLGLRKVCLSDFFRLNFFLWQERAYMYAPKFPSLLCYMPSCISPSLLLSDVGLCRWWSCTRWLTHIKGEGCQVRWHSPVVPATGVTEVDHVRLWVLDEPGHIGRAHLKDQRSRERKVWGNVANREVNMIKYTWKKMLSWNPRFVLLICA